MMSAKFRILLPLPHLQFHATSFTNLPYCICFWCTPFPPPSVDVIYTCPLRLPPPTQLKLGERHRCRERGTPFELIPFVGCPRPKFDIASHPLLTPLFSDGYSQIFRLVCVWPFTLEGLWLRYATLQNLIPSLLWIAPGPGIKFCHLATLPHPISRS